MPPMWVSPLTSESSFARWLSSFTSMNFSLFTKSFVPKVLLVARNFLDPGNKLPGYYFGHTYGTFAHASIITHRSKLHNTSVIMLAHFDRQCEFLHSLIYFTKILFGIPTQNDCINKDEIVKESFQWKKGLLNLRKPLIKPPDSRDRHFRVFGRHTSLFPSGFHPGQIPYRDSIPPGFFFRCFKPLKSCFLHTARDYLKSWDRLRSAAADRSDKAKLFPLFSILTNVEIFHFALELIFDFENYPSSFKMTNL